MRRVVFLLGFLWLASSTALPQDAVTVSPATHKVLLENGRVRVLDVRVKPGEKLTMHSHPGSVVYFLSGGKTRFTYPDGKTEEREGKAGAAVWSEAETHATENVGTTELHVLQIELKGAAQNPAQAKKDSILRVGFLAPQGRSLPLFDAFRQGLAELGYVEGQNIVIEPRFAEGQYERFPELFAELVRLKVDVLVVTGAVTARAAKKAVTDMPIVFAVVVDPVADNVVSSLERPGGNLTGVTSFDPRQATKQLELLTEVVPGLRRVAILGDQGVSEALMKASEEQARALGLQPQRLRLAGPIPDLEAAFAAIKQGQAGALLILEEPVLGVHAKRIAELAAKDRLPTLFAPSRVGAGGLIAYGTSQVAAIRRMAAYVDKVLKGAKPSELSVEKVTRYELIVNLKTAREIGVTIPPEVLKRADRVIQ